jgi:hypothetical protein
METLAEAPHNQQYSSVHFASAMLFNIWDMLSAYIVSGGIPALTDSHLNTCMICHRARG